MFRFTYLGHSKGCFNNLTFSVVIDLNIYYSKDKKASRLCVKLGDKIIEIKRDEDEELFKQVDKFLKEKL